MRKAGSIDYTNMKNTNSKNIFNHNINNINNTHSKVRRKNNSISATASEVIDF